jgi:hypothetical protein
MERDPSLDTLRDLEGQGQVLDSEARYWVRFVVKAAPASVERPHGLNYSLTLHGPQGERLAGFDNAHAIQTRSGPGGRKPGAVDHQHRLQTVRPYEYQDAATLLADFRGTVDAVLREKGVIR